MNSIATLSHEDRKALRDLATELTLKPWAYADDNPLIELLKRLGEEPKPEPKVKKGPALSQIHVALIDAVSILRGDLTPTITYSNLMIRCLLRARELLMNDAPIISGDPEQRFKPVIDLLSQPEPRTGTKTTAKKPAPSQLQLTGRQILALANFAIPCMVVDLRAVDPTHLAGGPDVAPMLDELDTQLNSEVVVCCGDEEGHHLAWLADYPGEGSVPLDPTEPVVMQFKWLPVAAETYKHLAARKGQKESNDD